MIDFNGSYVYILSRNEHDKYSVYIYNYKSDFKQGKRISLPKKKTYLITHNQQVNPIDEIILTHKCQEN